MPENWMGWAQVIGAFITGTVLAVVAGWKIWTKLLRPVIKRFEPIVQEITGPGQEPGLRKMVSDVQTVGESALRVAVQTNESINLLRRDVQKGALDHETLAQTTRESLARFGERVGAVEVSVGRVEGRLERVERVQDAAREGAGATTEGGPGSTGATGPEKSPPPPGAILPGDGSGVDTKV
jgi:hypothetical protein